jgi:adenylate cyclase
MSQTRRLAGILAADVAGYSRLMGADEEGTHERLKAHLRELIDPKITEHRGRIVKNTGDGWLAEFPSVVDAVRCAVEVQRGMVDREPEVREDQRIRFRIGVNLGDVIAEEHDIFGDGVNVAARLEALAEPGGISISRVVRDQIRDKLPYPFEDRGEQSVKNIARPVRVYALRPEAIAEVTLTGLPVAALRRRRLTIRPAIAAASLMAVLGIAAGAWWLLHATKSSPALVAATSIAQPFVAPRLSIVVLPFANLNNDPDQQYFADGITEDLTTDLSRTPDMFVISRNTAFTYRNKPIDTKQIGRELGVRYVLEGSVQRSGSQIRVNAQLINAETDAHLWAERFDRDASELFALQDEITTRIANALGLELIAAEVARPTENPDALDYILQGRAAFAKGPAREHKDEAIGFFERALAVDRLSVEAQARLAQVLAARVREDQSDASPADIERAEGLVRQALALSPRSTLVHSAKGGLLRAEGRWGEAISEFETVLASNPNSDFAQFSIGICRVQIGLVSDAIPPLEQSIRLNPRDPYIVYRFSWLGLAHLLQSHADEAIVWFDKARGAMPAASGPHINLAAAYGFNGEIERATAELAEVRRLRHGDFGLSIAGVKSSAAWRTSTPKTLAMAEATFFTGLRKAGLPEE